MNTIEAIIRSLEALDFLGNTATTASSQASQALAIHSHLCRVSQRFHPPFIHSLSLCYWCIPSKTSHISKRHISHSMANRELDLKSSVSLDLESRISVPLNKARRTQTEPASAVKFAPPSRQRTGTSGFSAPNQNERSLTQPVLLKAAGRRLHTPWISSPITRHIARHDSSKESETEPLGQNHGDEHVHSRNEDEDHILSTRQGSSTIELLYDLFFTANLSQFTSDHQIDNKQGMFYIFIIRTTLNSHSARFLHRVRLSFVVYLAANLTIRRSILYRLGGLTCVQMHIVRGDDWVCFGRAKIQY